MIDSVRNTVISILNKANYGNIPIADFNLFVGMAQLDIFTTWFKDYNVAIIQEINRKSGTDYADKKKLLEDHIDTFAEHNFLTYSATNEFFLPSDITLGHKYYRMDVINIHDVNSGVYLAKAEPVTNAMIDMLGSSLNTMPSATFPVYSQTGNKIIVLPNSVASAQGMVKARYIRYPKTPKWTYISLANGEPIFDQTATDYQDIELPADEEDNLVNKVLLMCGMSIREIEVVKYAKVEEKQDDREDRRYQRQQ